VIAGEACGVAWSVYGNKGDIVDPTHERGFRAFTVVASAAWIGLASWKACEQPALV